MFLKTITQICTCYITTFFLKDSNWKIIYILIVKLYMNFLLLIFDVFSVKVKGLLSMREVPRSSPLEGSKK